MKVKTHITCGSIPHGVSSMDLPADLANTSMRSGRPDPNAPPVVLERRALSHGLRELQSAGRHGAF